MLYIICPLLLVASVFSQAGTRSSFGDYPVHHIYKGKPAAPILKKHQRMFRTMIRLGAKEPVEFAGHYTVPRWGCGTGCNGFAIVDSISGRVFDAPFYVSELPMKWEEEQAQDVDRMEFRPDSRLLRINACPNEHNCGFYDYLMVEGKGLRLLRKELLPTEYQY